MKNLHVTLADLDRRRPRVLGEIHPQLRLLVVPMLEQLGDRFAPYCGFRDSGDQAKALAAGASNAAFGESPHNFSPALAIDVVLDPRRVPVRAAPSSPEWPDLWDEETPEALAAWEALELAAVAAGLERVDIVVHGVKRRDKPHVQLHAWRSLIPH